MEKFNNHPSQPAVPSVFQAYTPAPCLDSPIVPYTKGRSQGIVLILFIEFGSDGKGALEKSGASFLFPHNLPERSDIRVARFPLHEKVTPSREDLSGLRQTVQLA